MTTENDLTYEYHTIPARIYWWVVAVCQGRTVLIGPEETEEEANRLGFEKLDGNFEVVSLPTKDRHRAAAMLKAKKLKETGNLEKSLEKVRHKV